jgi:hypothetical protein
MGLAGFLIVISPSSAGYCRGAGANFPVELRCLRV